MKVARQLQTVPARPEGPPSQRAEVRNSDHRPPPGCQERPHPSQRIDGIGHVLQNLIHADDVPPLALVRVRLERPHGHRRRTRRVRRRDRAVLGLDSVRVDAGRPERPDGGAVSGTHVEHPGARGEGATHVGVGHHDGRHPARGIPRRARRGPTDRALHHAPGQRLGRVLLVGVRIPGHGVVRPGLDPTQSAPVGRRGPRTSLPCPRDGPSPRARASVGAAAEPAGAAHGSGGGIGTATCRRRVAAASGERVPPGAAPPTGGGR